MLIHRDRLKHALSQVARQRIAQGCALDERVVFERIETAAGSYDALYDLALELRDPPLRPDWPYVEPLAWDDIVAASPELAPTRAWPEPDLPRASERTRAGFLGSVCGCILGKPIEIDPSLAQLKQAGEAAGEWPVDDYITPAFLDCLGRRHDSWSLTTRGNIRCVAADDDLHYSIIGMLLLESHGSAFSAGELFETWTLNLPPGWAWGAERTALLTTALNGHHLFPGARFEDCHDVLLLNPGDEMCGALIRADAYGYACPGNPDLAAWLAWKDASFTHIKTGVYGAMFIAALIATCHTADALGPGNHRLELVDDALRRIPANARLSAVIRDAVDRIALAADWESGYHAIHGAYPDFTHCTVYQEIGTLVNTLKFARNTGHGICLQVSQGNDTDSFGATAGSILGVLFGPEGLEKRWLAPFGNRIEHALADLHEYSLDAIAGRMARLPETLYRSQLDR